MQSPLTQISIPGLLERFSKGISGSLPKVGRFLRSRRGSLGERALPVWKWVSRTSLRTLLCSALLVQATAAHRVLVEAESFEQHGGWRLDTQFIEIMGSPYLLAHGLGEPVPDATTTVSFPKTGRYRVFVRTKDWVARWNAPGQPGRFQVLIDDTPLPATFGTQGADWFWHDGGTVDITRTTVTLALRDLTGFDGRCDAVLFTDALSDIPPAGNAPPAAWRRAFLGLPDQPRNADRFDLVVVGGGYAGTATALSAARMGCRVALVQNRPVLGGNGSSEIRVWAKGGTRRGLYPRLGEIVEEFADHATLSPGTYEEFGDGKKEEVVRNEPNISLFLNHHVYRVETKGSRIAAVVALHTRTSEEVRFEAQLFADCTGHATVGYLAGADHDVQQEDHLGMSNMWRWDKADAPRAFPETPWALQLDMADFPYPVKGHGQWFWESGFDLNPIHDLEAIRDWNLRAVFGAFNAMKNGDGREQHRRAYLTWVAYIGGNRESRRLMGDVLLTRDDIVTKREFDDGCVATTWDIDLHYPEPKFMEKYPENPYISYAHFDKRVDRKNGYPVPYRCFYSRNIGNLFMAGRCISVTHEALGTVRVMRTGGMMGEVVGKAASVCIKHQCSPREVYSTHLPELQELMRLPGAAHRTTVHDPITIPENALHLRPANMEYVDPTELPGIVVDDTRAQLVGDWQPGEGLQGYVGDHYLYLAPNAEGSVTFRFMVPESGMYEVRTAHQPHENRSTGTRVSVVSAAASKDTHVNQRQPAPLEHGFVSLGVYPFEAGKVGSVIISSVDSDGYTHADAVQILPVTPGSAR